MRLVLAASHTHAGLAAQLGHLQHVVLGDRLLKEADVIGGQRPRQLHCVEIVEAAIGIDEQLGILACRVADGGDTRLVLADHVTQQPRLVTALQCRIADSHFQP